MKNLVKSTRFGLLAVIVAGLLIVVPTGTLVVGCASTKKSEQAAYKTLYSVGSVANVAVDSWLKYYLLESFNTSKQPVSDSRDAKLKSLRAQDQQIAELYSKFQTSYNTALSAAQLDVTVLSPAEVTRLCAELAATVAQFTGN